MAMTSPTFNAKGDVEIRYVNGSVCDEDASLNYQTKITFKCKPGVFPGKPVLGEFCLLNFQLYVEDHLFDFTISSVLYF